MRFSKNQSGAFKWSEDCFRKDLQKENQRKNLGNFQAYFGNDLLNQFHNMAGILERFTYSLFSDIVLPWYFG